MSHRDQTLEAITRLLSYPTETYVEAAELLYVILHSDLPEAAACMAEFGAFVEPRETIELEEIYARTFDINPACALEIGWHLFGEEYARGLLLVRLRAEMRDRGLEESTELPDHIAHVLALIAAMPDDEAQRFVHACVQTAIDKMHAALERAESPYQHVLRCLVLVLEHDFGRADTGDENESNEAESARSLQGGGPPRSNSMPRNAMPGNGQNPFQGDPLRDFPMPCGGCEPVEPVELIQLQASCDRDIDAAVPTTWQGETPTRQGDKHE